MLSVAGLTAHYGTAQVLFGLDFDLLEGSVTTLLERNGAGKTTTTRAIMGVRSAAADRSPIAGNALMGLPLTGGQALGCRSCPRTGGYIHT